MVLAPPGRPDAASYVRTWAGMGSVVHKTAMAASFVAGFIHLCASPSNTTRCRLPPRGVKGLRSHSHGSQGKSLQDAGCGLRRISILSTPLNSARTRRAHRRDVSHHSKGRTSLARQGIHDTMPFRTHQRNGAGVLGENRITNANGPIRVLLADDHTMFREGLA